MKKILITGASGFIGRCTLVPLLLDGFEVYATCHKQNGPDLGPVQANWLKVDLLDQRQIADLIERIKPEYLLHLAWDIRGDYRSSRANIDWMNATVFLMDCFSRYGKRAVLAGTCFEYDLSKPTFESQAIQIPNTLYGTCKNATFKILSQMSFPNTTWAWARPFYLFGPREAPTRLVPSVIQSLLEPGGHLSIKNNGLHTVDYLYVEDVADALITILKSGITGDLNVASGDPITVKELVHSIGDVVDAPVDNIKFGLENHNLGNIITGPGKLLGNLNWTPKIGLTRGLVRTVNWWRLLLTPKPAPPVIEPEIVEGKDEVYEEINVSNEG